MPSCNPDAAQIIIDIWDKQVGNLVEHLSYFYLGHGTMATAQESIHGLLTYFILPLYQKTILRNLYFIKFSQLLLMSGNFCKLLCLFL